MKPDHKRTILAGGGESVTWGTLPLPRTIGDGSESEEDDEDELK
jgi:hypothetical protein